MILAYGIPVLLLVGLSLIVGVMDTGYRPKPAIVPVRFVGRASVEYRPRHLNRSRPFPYSIVVAHQKAIGGAA